MAGVKQFRVTQTRSVEVIAITSEDAIRIASAAFRNGQNMGGGVINGPEGVYGNTTNSIQEVDLECHSKGYLL